MNHVKGYSHVNLNCLKHEYINFIIKPGSTETSITQVDPLLPTQKGWKCRIFKLHLEDNN